MCSMRAQLRAVALTPPLQSATRAAVAGEAATRLIAAAGDGDGGRPAVLNTKVWIRGRFGHAPSCQPFQYALRSCPAQCGSRCGELRCTHRCVSVSALSARVH